MAIGFITTPSVVSFTNNEIAVRVSSSEYITTPGSKAVISFYISLFRPANNVNITFNFKGISIDLSFKDTPTTAENDMPAFTTYSNQVWATLLKNAFKGNPTISEHFTIKEVPSTAGIKIILTAREEGQWHLSLSNPTGTAIFDGTNPIINENLNIICRVECKNEYIKQRLPINSEGEAVFYLQDILKSFLYDKYSNIKLPPIELPTNIGFLNDETQVDYDIWLKEEFGVVEKRYVNLNALCDVRFVAYTGGISKFAPYQSPLYIYPGHKLGVLSHQPKAKKILSYKEPEWITFTTNAFEINNLNYVIELKDTNNNIINTLNVNNFELNTIAKYTKFTLPFALQDIIDLSTINITNCAEYNIKLYSSNELLFENTYRLKPHCKNYRYYVIENSLGGIDTFRLEGVLQKETKSKKTNAERVEDFQRPKHIGSQWTTDVNNTESIKLKCDFFQSEKWAEYFREIQYSLRMFEYIVDKPYYADHQALFKAEYKAINTKGSTFSVGNSKDRAYRFTFNYNYSNIENSF